MLWDWSNARWIVCGKRTTHHPLVLRGTSSYDFPLIIGAIDPRTMGLNARRRSNSILCRKAFSLGLTHGSDTRATVINIDALVAVATLYECPFDRIL